MQIVLGGSKVAFQLHLYVKERICSLEYCYVHVGELQAKKEEGFECRIFVHGLKPLLHFSVAVFHKMSAK